MSHSGRRCHRAVRALLVAALLLACRPGGAAELAAFVSGATPGPNWSGGGFGVSLAITPPPLGPFVPYGGLGVGAYKQNLASHDQWGTVSGVFVGARIKLPLGILIKGEYEWVTLPNDALMKMDGRYYGGVGISF